MHLCMPRSILYGAPKNGFMRLPPFFFFMTSFPPDHRLERKEKMLNKPSPHITLSICQFFHPNLALPCLNLDRSLPEKNSCSPFVHHSCFCFVLVTPLNAGPSRLIPLSIPPHIPPPSYPSQTPLPMRRKLPICAPKKCTLHLQYPQTSGFVQLHASPVTLPPDPQNAPQSTSEYPSPYTAYSQTPSSPPPSPSPNYHS